MADKLYIYTYHIICNVNISLSLTVLYVCKYIVIVAKFHHSSFIGSRPFVNECIIHLYTVTIYKYSLLSHRVRWILALVYTKSS